MPIIPPRLSAAEQSNRMDFLEDIKQKRFVYKDAAPDLPIPNLDPAKIPIILAEQREYWFDAEWKRRDQERRGFVMGAYFLPPNGYPSALGNYGDVKEPYPEVGALSHTPKFSDDRSFGAQRLSGVNPLVIERVMDLGDFSDRLAITDDHILPDIKLEQAVEEKRLYICDYKNLTAFAGVGGVSSDQLPFNLPQTKYLTAPIALFYWKGPFDDTGDLIPIAIQLEQIKSAKVFTPLGSKSFTTPNNWLLAKAAVQVADALSHEWDSHIVRTHFTLGPFAVSSERWLYDEHPVLILLRPHLRYLLGINSKTGELVAQGEYGDQLLSPTYEDQIKFLIHNFKRYDFSLMANPTDEISKRNMDEHNAPIPYPYRDDGLPVYAAIREYVEDYLKIYYSDSADEVNEDNELQNFIKELRDDGGGRLDTLTPNGGEPVGKIGQLADLLAKVIWTSGPLHSAVNFAQWGYMGDPRNMPFAGYLELTQDPDVDLPNDPVEFFPRYSQAKVQAGVMYVLGSWRMDMLGFYRFKDFLDPHALKVIAKFQCELAKIGADTFQRDATRKATYPYLFPWNITNSTSI